MPTCFDEYFVGVLDFSLIIFLVISLHLYNPELSRHDIIYVHKQEYTLGRCTRVNLFWKVPTVALSNFTFF